VNYRLDRNAPEPEQEARRLQAPGPAIFTLDTRPAQLAALLVDPGGELYDEKEWSENTPSSAPYDYLESIAQPPPDEASATKPSDTPRVTVSSLEDAIERSRELEDIASTIQKGRQQGLTSEQIGDFVEDYLTWYAESLALLPPEYHERFRGEYEGKFLPRIKGFLSAPTSVSPIYNPSLEGNPFNTYWQHPFESSFRTYVLAPGASAYLIASATLDVGPTPYLIQFYDQTTRLYVDQCATGNNCATTVTQTQATQHLYVSYVSCCGQSYPPPAPRAMSNSALATWISVQLFACSGKDVAGCTATNTTGAGTGAYITLNAVATGKVDYSPYLIELYDQAGTFLTACPNGSSCAYSVTESSAGTHTFIAFVSRNGNTYPPPDVQAQTVPLSLPWVVNCTSGVSTTNTPATRPRSRTTSSCTRRSMAP
jgi:hypothetical protein